MMNKIERRYYVAVKLKLCSPLSVANGEEQYTDSDIIRDADGEPFLPGTSIAGAFRAYIEQKKDESGIMGFSRNKEGRMSALFIEDAYFENSRISVRDGVRLQERIVEKGGKFDFEIVETGAQTTLYLEYVKREQDTEDGLALIAKIICGLENGEIRFGAKKNRGLGNVKVVQAYKKEFGSGQRKEWIDFCGEAESKRLEKYEKWNEWRKLVQSDEKYVTMSIPLRLSGGISIRKYSAEPNKADFEHITCNGKPVIPGSSWNGAIRARADEILEDLECSAEKRKNLIDNWFGYVRQGSEGKQEACQSTVVFGESILEGSTKLAATRNKINRFDASTVEGGLYTEISYYGGTTNLQIKIRKTDGYQGLMGMMYLVTDEIKEGYLAIGGQTAVGRGIFIQNGETEIMTKDVIEREEALCELSLCID